MKSVASVMIEIKLVDVLMIEKNMINELLYA
jgi:hypothetical protein